MSLLDHLRSIFNKRKHQPEDDYITIVTDELVKVEHPKWKCVWVKWEDLHTVLLVNTDEGPWLPDVWLTLVGTDSSCRIPLGSNRFEEVYAIVSKYPKFNFENVTKSMSCTNNAEFILWRREAMKPQQNESEIIGNWLLDSGKMRADDNCKRIEWLVKNYLIKVSANNGNWDMLYQDPDDGRYWMLSYPQSGMQGGGPPMLECVDGIK